MMNNYQTIPNGDDSEISVKSDFVLTAYAIFSKITASFLALIAISSVVVTVRDTSFSGSNNIVHLMLRIYSLVFMCIAFLCEMEWLEPVRQSAVFHHWVFRGIFYSYLGLFSFVEFSNYRIDRLTYSWIPETFSILVFSCGIAYSLLGIFNGQHIKNERTIEYIQLLTRNELQSSSLEAPTHTR
mmetsp:Transcript_2436/g.5164  ORF Transcript_2436/g.5164 Transcript_2436/m.5164 type:complete len:184 (-) Transcript_2436:175-726(-)